MVIHPAGRTPVTPPGNPSLLPSVPLQFGYFYVARGAIGHITPTWHEGIVLRLEGRSCAVQKYKDGTVALERFSSIKDATACVSRCGSCDADLKRRIRWKGNRCPTLREVQQWVDAQPKKYDFFGANCQAFVCVRCGVATL